MDMEFSKWLEQIEKQLFRYCQNREVYGQDQKQTIGDRIKSIFTQVLYQMIGALQPEFCAETIAVFSYRFKFYIQNSCYHTCVESR